MINARTVTRSGSSRGPFIVVKDGKASSVDSFPSVRFFGRGLRHVSSVQHKSESGFSRVFSSTVCRVF